MLLYLIRVTGFDAFRGHGMSLVMVSLKPPLDRVAGFDAFMDDGFAGFDAFMDYGVWF